MILDVIRVKVPGFGPGPLARVIATAVHRWLRDPVECGVFHFIGQTIARSLKHLLFLATYGGLGAAGSFPFRRLYSSSPKGAIYHRLRWEPGLY
jgi:hypothetical protein